MSDYKLLQQQLARARRDAEEGRIFPMEQWLMIINLSNTTPTVVDEINEIRKIGYGREIDYQFGLTEFYVNCKNSSAAIGCLEHIETYAERGNIPLPTERIDAIKKKLGIKLLNFLKI